MQQKKAAIQFGVNGLTAMIIFANGKESQIYSSQSEIMKDLSDMVRKNKLSSEEASEIVLEVMSSTTLPYDEPKRTAQDFISKLFNSNLFFDALNMSFDGSHMVDAHYAQKIFAAEIEQGDVNTKPVFKLCSCGQHGMILWKITDVGVRTSTCSLQTKQQAIAALEHYKTETGLSAEDESNLRLQISECALPESLVQAAKKRAAKQKM